MVISVRKTFFSRRLLPIYFSNKNGLKNKSIRLYSNDELTFKKKEISSKSIAPGYNPTSTEAGWYDWWESKGFFKPRGDGKLFTVLLPPPNLTGTLHLGHALTITIQDVLIRWMRMRGESVLWIPGFDHAGIATQVAVEKYLINVLNLTKYDLGKKEFLQKILEWKNEKEKIITSQMKQMAASVDWDRKYFTMDTANSEAVARAFIQLHEKGLIFRLSKHVSWSCFLRSGISDIEVDWKEINNPSKINIPGYRKPIEFGYLYKFAYKIHNSDSEGEEIVVATTRPETMLGDTAVAVHPDDSRYSHLKGKLVWHPFRMCTIPIIFDKDVKPEFGTGAVKITPAHSPQDLEIAERHNLEILDVIDESGLVCNKECYSKFQGMKRFDVREKILNELQNLGLYREKVQHSSIIPVCSRSGDVIEFISKPQWFLKCSDMVNKVQEALLKETVTIEPSYCIKILLEWFKRSKDWNLSRQLWWGHPIPMYECTAGNKTLWIPAMSMEEAAEAAVKKFEIDKSNIDIRQDTDVLDTWFSSCLLPFSVAGWPDRLNMGDRYSNTYPLSLMETGQDIVFFWVARMLMLGLELTGEFPFRKVLLHGLVCDSYGRKMSKSLGNVVLPEEVIRGSSLEEMKSQAERNFRIGTLSKNELKRCLDGQKKMFPTGIPECGADALRLTLCSDKIKNENLNFNVDVCRANKFFCNKMWQATLYLLRNVENRSNLTSVLPHTEELSLFDHWILGSLAKAVQSVNEGIETFQYHSSIDAIKNFVVKELCDLYLESTKDVFKGNAEKDVQRVVAVLFNCLDSTFRLLSPFMPFVTEELYHCLPRLQGFVPYESVTIAKYPNFDNWEPYYDEGVEVVMSKFIRILFALRSMRTVYKLSKQRLKVLINCPPKLEGLFCSELTNFLKKYASLDDISRVSGEVSERNVITQVIEDCTIHLYHEHDRDTLREIFASVLLKENNLKECLQKLSLTIAQPNYETETPAEIKKKNSVVVSNLLAELKKIAELKEVIEKAH